MNAISDAFEQNFLSVPLSRQIEVCDSYELAPLFDELLPSLQPILEAGCGSGRWVGWFAAHNWQAIGIDWSNALCERARVAIPNARFVTGDIRNMPIEDASVGSIVSLGAIEHAIDGPLAALREYSRVLRPGGIAIITVPHGGWLRRMLRKPLNWARTNRLIRFLAGKSNTGIRIEDARRRAVRAWFPSFGRNATGWYFYEYDFTRKQTRDFLLQAGFEIVREAVGFKEEGILHNFGRLAGTYDNQNACARFSFLGRVLFRIMPVRLTGHMVTFVAKKLND